MIISKEKLIYLLQLKNISSLKTLNNTLSVNTGNILFINKFLKDNNNQLIALTAIDDPQRFNRFNVNYIYNDYHTSNRIYVSSKISSTINSITEIFSSAIWLERECYDMFGIFFTSDTKQPTDLRRILTDYNFKGHPLRRDFALIGYGEKLYSHLTKTIKEKKNLFY
jgi:NADH-quinone oxidoreductase subunit C